MERFVLNASKKLDNIERELRQARESFDKCLDHFCITRGTMDSDEFFGILSEFFDQFEKAVAALELRHRQKMHNASKSGLMNPNYMKMRRESAMSFSDVRNSNGGSDSTTPRKVSYQPRPSIFGRMRPVKN